MVDLYLQLNNIDHGNKYFFLLTATGSQALPLYRVQNNHLYFVYHPILQQFKTLEGFIILSEQRGILYMKVNLTENIQTEQKFDIVSAQIDLNSFKMVNRRMFFRYHCENPIPSHFIYNENSYPITINNFSAGGLNVATHVELDIHGNYSLQLALPVFDNKNILANVKLTYLKKDHANIHHYGVSYINFFDQQQKQIQSNVVQDKIIRYVNQQLVKQHQLAKQRKA